MFQIEAWIPDSATDEACALLEASGVPPTAITRESEAGSPASRHQRRLVVTIALAQAMALMPALGDFMARVDGLAFVSQVG